MPLTAKIAYIFPGQGSQAVGMLHDAADAVAPTFDEASDVLGYDLWRLVSSGPEDRLKQTEYTQPALLTASVALYRLAVAQSLPQPEIVAGHSLGEYSALVAARVIEFRDAVSLVQKRGQYMQTAVPLGEGGMAAILGLTDEEVETVCQNASDPKGGNLVQIANFNAPGQTVIAGKAGALESAIEGCKKAGARRAVPLAVSAPFHSVLMQPAAEKMQAALAEVTFNKPQMQVIQNVDASLQEEPDSIRANLVRQMSGAVLWTSTVQKMKALGVNTLVECGPGKVLTGLAKRIDKSMTGLNIDSLQAINDIAGLEQS